MQRRRPNGVGRALPFVIQREMRFERADSKEWNRERNDSEGEERLKLEREEIFSFLSFVLFLEHLE